MIRVLNYFLECVKLLSDSFHLNIHRSVSNATSNKSTVQYISDVSNMHTIQLIKFVQCISDMK